MIELIRIIFFGGNLLVTPEPIFVGTKPTTIELRKPLIALNCSASFNVDVREHITSDNYPEFVNEAESKFPDNCLNIQLQSENGAIASFSNSSVTWNSPSDVSINLKATSKFNEKLKYSKLSISSCRDLNSTEITWYNYGNITCNSK
ncbi:MAG: hypothetical protein H7A09_03195 [Oceanospirillaceae bacterium]|nr:hypothetical protein [Oceanospirillaceae bacterium]MCP5336004.1 hypothetical protein [Oceanospirillaceae bacterium]